MNRRFPPLRWGLKEASQAFIWGFNCGPAALCAVTGLTPAEVRPHLVDFECKRYTNPTLMVKALESLRIPFSRTYRSDEPGPVPAVQFGLVRIQWGGRWTRPGVPMRVRYRKTHWVAMGNLSLEVFDINAVFYGLDWVPRSEWSTRIVPDMIHECCPDGDGTWWVTHVFEIPIP